MNEYAKVLIVDDDEYNVKLLSDTLKFAGYHLAVARNGKQALATVKSDKEIKLVLLDVILPDMDGFEICKRIRQDQETKDLAVIMVTALDSPKEKALGIESGADDLLVKPFYIPELLGRVKNILAAKLARQRLEDAYSSVHSILGYSVKVLENFDPMRSDFDWAQKEFINHIFTCMHVRPELIVIISTDQTDELNGFTYHWDYRGHALVKERVRVTIPSNLNCLRQKNDICIHEYNHSTTKKKCGQCLPKEIAARLSRLDNHVICLAGGLMTIAINFPGQVGMLQGQLLKGATLQLMLYRTIYLQTRNIRKAFIYTAGALARAAEAIDGETGHHIERVGEYSYELARVLQLSSPEQDEIAYSAKMHDVGKMKISPDILLKPGPLTKEEFMEMENHTVYGVMILGDSPYLDMARDIALYHHERWNGTGYPYGLKGEEIPLPARIVAIVDVYDALRSKRPYKPGLSHEYTCGVIMDGDDRVKPEHFCPDILKVFKESADKFDRIFESNRG